MWVTQKEVIEWSTNHSSYKLPLQVLVLQFVPLSRTTLGGKVSVSFTLEIVLLSSFLGYLFSKSTGKLDFVSFAVNISFPLAYLLESNLKWVSNSKNNILLIQIKKCHRKPWLWINTRSYGLLLLATAEGLGFGLWKCLRATK